ncbi:MAG: adenylosuccinate lyase [Candidatus Margulisiibacteriota bacterium]|nr:MAG: adenylosuccinate lyase [Candidatus Margulisbacteria bacterium GWD2_39_127]OGI05441.1 MAG: adenylosuccinate lyase [Candidatus Margulisbacteria bacterium GWF2_38_17]OGI07821.1 MAG: adenylosuccinate lyase [Candidatus Margulisbacteria bacterium GWE2_39_32]PZM80123.1 MAG: adenylosuccinate lyase [Candidatus Margulisiibacteriota bacterium]HAR62611.1 adenylosuccinate lyase [Candidatus Margulisiibacteriota bacterium]
MIERYTTPEMKQIWTEQNKFQKWLDVELAACEAHNKLGNIPDESLKTIKNKATFEINRINEIEKTTNHDVIAFLTSVAENVGPESRFIHLGMTSSDVVDTAFAILIKESGQQLLTRIKELQAAIKERALEHKNTIMIGRTHGVHAEPMTFGLKLALWYEEMERNTQRLERAIENISFGKLSGAVGTYANIDPFIEEYVCKKLKLTPAKISTQILQRDRHAEFMTTLAITAGSLEKFSTEIRALQKTEFNEAEEGFTKGQKGSSAMPHKKNPITCERITGLARVIRGNSLVAIENMALWHERDISHSSTERIIFPDSTLALDYMLKLFVGVVTNLVVHPDNMKRNLESTGGLVFSQRVLLKLVDSGLTREDSYKIVQENAMKSREHNFKVTFIDICNQDERILSRISKESLNECFDYGFHTKNIDMIFGRIFE